MLNRLLDGHPELGNTINESYIFEYYYSTGWRYEKQVIDWLKTAPIDAVYEQIAARQLLPCFGRENYYDAALREMGMCFHMDFDPEGFRKLLDDRRQHIGSMKDLTYHWLDILSLFRPWSQMSDTMKWLIKCTNFGASMIGASKLGIPYSAVFLVRDSLAIMNSMKRLRQREDWREYHVFELLEICAALENVSHALEQTNGNYLIVQYEDLVADTESVLREICAFWDIPWHDNLGNATLLGASWKPNSSFIAERRRDVLTEWEKQMVQRYTVGYRRDFGYQG